MNRERWTEVDEHFVRALEMPEAQRAGFVREVLVRNPELGLAVKDLLECAAEAEPVLGESGTMFAGPLLTALDEAAWSALHPGAIIGEHRVVREVARDHVASVLLAEPLDARAGKRVAVTVAVRGAHPADALARLAYDGEKLAELDHPGIARLQAAAVLADGRPYIAMEWVDGTPLLKHCDEQGLGVEARLRLFQQACAAVHFAHQHLVVHRDLRASGILVTGRGLAKIVSFGSVALRSPAGAPGTDRPAAPVTTATDVTALGFILQELLAGKLFSASRQGDLDAIVARATRTSNDERYESAAALADDVTRHLDGWPVHARPATAGYRTSRFIRRHRVRLAIAAGIMVTGLVSQAPRLLRARHAPAAGVDALQAPSVAVPSSPVADSANEDLPPFDTVTVAKLAAQSDELQSMPDRQPSAPRAPERVAAVAVAPLTRTVAMPSITPPGRDSAAALRRLATTLRRAGRSAEAERALREALAISIGLDGSENLQVASEQWELGDLLRTTQRYREAEELLRQSLRTRQRLASPTGAEVGQSLTALALLECEQGRTSQSDSLFRQAMDIYRKLPAGADGLSVPETYRASCR